MFVYFELLSSRKVLVLKDQLTSSCPWTTKSSKIFKDFAFSKLSVTNDHLTSVNSVTATVHDDTVKNVLLTDVRYYYLLIMSAYVGDTKVE